MVQRVAVSPYLQRLVGEEDQLQPQGHDNIPWQQEKVAGKFRRNGPVPVSQGRGIDRKSKKQEPISWMDCHTS